MSLTAKKRAAIKQRLAELEREHGKLTASQVLNDAMQKNSPLHDQFEWDDSTAAHKHRLEQARTLIRSIRVVSTTTQVTKPVPVYVRDPGARAADQGYKSTVRLKSHKQAARDALLEAIGQARAHVLRAQKVAAALDLDTDVAEILEKIEAFQCKISRKKAA